MIKKQNKYNAILERELTSLEKSLLETLRERLNKIQSVSFNKSAEFMDTVSDSELDELAARIVESDSIKIDEIEEALHRLRQGQYGICSECSSFISKKRLEARPFATLCIKCKEKIERKDFNNSNNRSSYSPTASLDESTESYSTDPHETVRGNKF